MNRRDFVTSIAGLFTMAASAPGRLLPAYTPDGSIVTLTLSDQMTLLTKRLFDQLEKRITWPTLVVDDSKVDFSLPHQYSVDLSIGAREIEELTDDQIDTQFLLPVAAAISDALDRMRPSTFGTLPLPGGVDAGARVTSPKLSIRGLRSRAFATYHGEPEWMTRFDVLFSSNEPKTLRSNSSGNGRDRRRRPFEVPSFATGKRRARLSSAGILDGRARTADASDVPQG